MIFPEIRSLVKRAFLSLGLGSDPIALDLKSDNVTFDTINAGWYARNGYPQIYAALSGGAPAWSGEHVSLETALQHPVVYACNAIISETVGYIPPSMMQNVRGEKRLATEKPMYEAFKSSPNGEMTAQAFTETRTSHAVMRGGGFAKINRRSGTNVALTLDPLAPECVTPDREKTGRKRLVYVVSSTGESDKTYTVEYGKPHDILHIPGLGWDGIRGYSVIQMGRQSIGTAIASERNVGRFWANGGRRPYLLNIEDPFESDADFQKFRTNWDSTYSDPHKAMILEGGKKYEAIGSTMAEAQANEFRLAAVAELCRWFSVSPHLVADLSRATFSNIEHLTLEFVKITLAKWLSRWEQNFRLSVLTPDERAAGYYLHYNINALLRGDFKTRMEGYSIALQNSFLNPDEVRELEDRNPLPDGAGKTYHFQMNMQTTPGTGDPTIVEQGIINRGLANGKTSASEAAKDLTAARLKIAAEAREAKQSDDLGHQIVDISTGLNRCYRNGSAMPEGTETNRRAS